MSERIFFQCPITSAKRVQHNLYFQLCAMISQYVHFYAKLSFVVVQLANVRLSYTFKELCKNKCSTSQPCCRPRLLTVAFPFHWTFRISLPATTFSSENNILFKLDRTYRTARAWAAFEFRSRHWQTDDWILKCFHFWTIGFRKLILPASALLHQLH